MKIVNARRGPGSSGEHFALVLEKLSAALGASRAVAGCGLVGDRFARVPEVVDAV
ncbi:UNVERIFIED_ORG: hypothetical protein J2791_004939 [Burkholderia contaminans]|nr:hypothetical protein [Burkholderia contaminans]